MEYKELNWVCPASTAKVVGFVAFAITLVFSALGLLASFAWILFSKISDGELGLIASDIFWMSGVLGILLIQPFMYWVIAYITTYLLCFAYNQCALRFGGIRYGSSSAP